MKATPGTVISGTMRDEDLISAFLGFIGGMDPAKEVTLAKTLEEECQDEEDRAMFLSEDLWDAMDAYSPDGHYFGTHPGDGADYGYWPVEEN